MSRDRHLGDLVAALVDNTLGHQARDRALVHLTRCDACRAEVDAHRRLKARLAGLAAPSCPAALVDRLRALVDGAPLGDGAGLPPDPVRARFRPAAARPSLARPSLARPTLPGPSRPMVADRRVSPTRPAGGRPTRGPGGRSRRRRVAGTAAGGLAVFAAGIATVVALGGSAEPPRVAPPVNTFTVEHSRVGGGLPGGDPDAGWLDAADANR